MLASVYSYRVMVKSVSTCCVRGRRVLSNPVTYIPIWNFDMVSFWLKLFKPPATLKVFPSIYFCLATNRRLAQLMFATKHNHEHNEHNQHNQ